MATKNKTTFLLHFTLLILSLLHRTSNAQTTTHPDTQPLLSFKSSADHSDSLSTWTPTTNPCTSSWSGVSCLQNRVSKLVLEDHNLQGPFPSSLLNLSNLRVLSLKHNHFSGPLPDLSPLFSLKLLFLSYNNFSGTFPPSLTSIFRLYRLDLSYNTFTGVIPQSINRLTHLLTLRLEKNGFSGQILWFDLPNIQDFNVSGNKLHGEIPKSLASFPSSAFLDNEALCGPPLLTSCKEVANDPAKPGNDAVSGSSPVGPTTAVVSSTPVSTVPSRVYPVGRKSANNRGRMSMWAIIAIIVGDILVLAAISLLLYCYFWRSNKRRGSGAISGGEKIVYSASPYTSGLSGLEQQRAGRMVFFEGGKNFELEDLLRASAEMLGKGVFGTAYKAVLDDGSVVAVKRLKEAHVGGGKKDFEQQMEVLGRLRHPNLVGLKAYYFARDEKLLVFDYLPNGSLFWLLHGNYYFSLYFLLHHCLLPFFYFFFFFHNEPIILATFF